MLKPISGLNIAINQCSVLDRLVGAYDHYFVYGSKRIHLMPPLGIEGTRLPFHGRGIGIIHMANEGIPGDIVRIKHILEYFVVFIDIPGLQIIIVITHYDAQPFILVGIVKRYQGGDNVPTLVLGTCI